MTVDSLARSMLEQGQQRLKVLPIFLENKAYGVAVRESQEVVELSLKAILRMCAIEPPKIHDVGPYLLVNRERIKTLGDIDVEMLAQASKTLRKDRELAFYGESDFIPTESYTLSQARQEVEWAEQAVDAARKVIQSS